MQLQAAGLWPAQPTIKYIENVFSTYLYSGNSSTQTITNGIDLSANGGLVWIKARQQTDGSTSPIGEHGLWDTIRGVGTSGSVNKALSSNATSAQNLGYTDADYVSAFNTTGFTVQNAGGTTTHRIANHAFQNYASWTFREQPKFFDVVTYTGNQVAGRTVAHNLGSAPGFIICKRTDTPDEWFCYHRSLGPSQQILLNSTAASGTNNNQWNNTAPTSSVFSLGTDSGANGTGGTYVAYLFAHNAGGFGLTGTDNVISCGTYAGNGSGSGSNTISLGYEPQYLLVKRSSGGVGSWWVIDNMRGATADGNDKLLAANTTSAEVSDQKIAFTATGFTLFDSSSEFNASGSNYIYVAIRRGPMKVPTSGTSVFTPVASRSSGTSQATPIFNAGFPVDLLLTGIKAGGGSFAIPRLTVGQLGTASTAAETSASATYNFGGMLGILSASGGDLSNATVCGWNFRRAPSFFDVVCYTGTGSSTTQAHNLAAVPEMMIIRRRTGSGYIWVTYAASQGNTKFAYLNSDQAFATDSYLASTTPTSSVFTVGTNGDVNASSATYIAYLFATIAGVSKIGSYTGTGAAQTINCGFTSGSRFVLIKRTDSTGDWYVWDSARGIIPSNDPYLLLNTTGAEVTGTDYVDTTSVGFDITSTAPAGINANGGTFIFLAIA
jgi:hypothetical protein